MLNEKSKEVPESASVVIKPSKMGLIFIKISYFFF